MSNYDVEVTMSGITTQTNVQQDLFETIEADTGGVVTVYHFTTTMRPI